MMMLVFCCAWELWDFWDGVCVTLGWDGLLGDELGRGAGGLYRGVSDGDNECGGGVLVVGSGEVEW